MGFLFLTKEEELLIGFYNFVFVQESKIKHE